MIILTFEEYYREGSHGFSHASIDIIEDFWKDYSYSYYYNLLNSFGDIKEKELKLINKILLIRYIKRNYYRYLFSQYQTLKRFDLYQEIIKNLKKNNINEHIFFQELIKNSKVCKLLKIDKFKNNDFNLKNINKQYYASIYDFLKKEKNFKWQKVLYRMCSQLKIRPNFNNLEKELKKEKFQLFLLIKKNEDLLSDCNKIININEFEDKDLFII